MSEFASYDSVESLYDNSQFYQISNYKSQQRPKLVATCFCTRKPGLYYAVDYFKKIYRQSYFGFANFFFFLGYYLKNIYPFNFIVTLLSLTIFTMVNPIDRVSASFTLILTRYIYIYF